MVISDVTFCLRVFLNFCFQTVSAMTSGRVLPRCPSVQFMPPKRITLLITIVKHGTIPEDVIYAVEKRWLTLNDLCAE